MSYIEEFQKKIEGRNFSGFLEVWEEYCTNETVDPEEFLKVLELIKISDFSQSFGKLAETALPLWQTIENKEKSYKILRAILDLQTTNSSSLAEIATQVLIDKYGNDSSFKQRLRIIGLRPMANYHGALSHFDLLAHMQKGKCVYHTGGWGTGEIMDVSPIREQISVEFENISGIKHFTFTNAFNSLLPLSDDHFLTQRFLYPDLLEKEAKKDPIKILKMLLKDLGPKSAPDIKDELCELVIPEKEWNRWWQLARSKAKKDTFIKQPQSIKDPFVLREEALTHEDNLLSIIKKKKSANEFLQTTYTYLRDFPHLLKKEEVKDTLIQRLESITTTEDVKLTEQIQALILLHQYLQYTPAKEKLMALIENTSNIIDVIQPIPILSLKKSSLQLIRKFRSDWKEIFSKVLFYPESNPIRDYIFVELNQESTKPLLIEKLGEMLKNPTLSPEAFFWYFQKISKKSKNEDVPFANKEGRGQFLDASLVLLHKIEGSNKHRDLSKKIYQFLTGKRYTTIRNIIEGMSLEFVKEFILLSSKCHTFSASELKIFRSLSAVVHPSLSLKKKSRIPDHLDGNIIWTTEEGYNKTQKRLDSISGVELVDSAKEVEKARSHGDLRENAEYKFALERRARLQTEYRILAQQLSRSRVITLPDISISEIGIGSTITLDDSKGNRSTYTILGPWDADPDKNILSFQSKLAQAMLGYKEEETFEFKGEKYKIVKISSFLDSNKN